MSWIFLNKADAFFRASFLWLVVVGLPVSYSYRVRYGMVLENAKRVILLFCHCRLDDEECVGRSTDEPYYYRNLARD